MKTKKNKARISNLKKIRARFYSALFSAKEISGITSKRFRAFRGGKAMKLFAKISSSVANTSSRFFGFASLTFGTVVLLMHLARYYLGTISAVSLTTAAVAAAFMLISVPFLIVKKPVGIALQENKITDFIVFEFFAFNPMSKNDSVWTLPPFVGIFLGLIPAVFAYFFPLRYVVLGIAAVIFLSASMISPEFPIMFSLVFLPYVGLVPRSAELIAIISVVAFISFARKVLIGKRVFSLDLSGVLLLVFAILTVVFSFIDGSLLSQKNSLVLASIILAYIPLSNMIVNRRLAICAVNAVTVSMIPVALGAIADYLIDLFKGEHAPADFIFGSSESLAAFLLVAALFTAFFVVERSQNSTKALYTLLLGIYVAAIITTECVPVVLVVLLFFPAYLIIKSFVIPRELLLIIALLPSAIFFLPYTVLEKISTFFFAMPNLVAIKAELYKSLLLFRDNIILGLGQDSVTDAGIGYAGTAVSWLLCDFGIIAAAVLVLVFLIRLRQFTVYSIYRSSSNVSNFISMGNLAAFALVALGVFHNIFSDYEVVYLFITAIGVSSAAIRISKRDHDDRLSYYGDQRSTDSSAVDVLLRH